MVKVMENNIIIIRTIDEMKKVMQQARQNQKTIGFVPTMGFLHEGHLTLVKQATEENDIVVMSIFVNPTQFGPDEDFDAYPRHEERDIALAAKAGVTYLFMPSKVEMYPKKSDIRILPGAQSAALCGASRPGHFDGVLQVVLKLFNIVTPHHSYFGMKDAQQLAIIESFVQDYNIPTKIHRVPTVREQDGLAKSSRNVNLTPKERQEAPSIYQSLLFGAKLVTEGYESKEIERQVQEQLEAQCSGVVDYVSVLTYPDLEQYEKDCDEVIIACAVQFSKARLIDNVILSIKG